MDTLALLIAPLLFIGAVLYIAYPLLQEKRGTFHAEDEQTELEKAVQQKEDVIETLKDIDMDFRMGKLSSEDYQALKNEFEQRAVKAFQRLESLEKTGRKSGKNKS